MTETFTIPSEAPAKGKKAASPIAPIYEEELSNHKKVRIRKGTGAGPLEIPKNILETLGGYKVDEKTGAAHSPQGVDLMWVARAVTGQPFPGEAQKFFINGWEPVTGKMFQGVFDGMYAEKGYQGELQVEDQVLCWRPMELTVEALNEMHLAARRPVEMTERKVRLGQIDGVTMNSTNKQVLDFNKASRQVVRGDIPIPD